MTEAEWRTSTDPEAMYPVVAQGAFRTGYPHSRATVRKRTFFGIACCRLVWPWVEADPRCRRAVEYLERMLDEPPSGDEEDEDDEEEEIFDDLKMAARHPDDGTPLHQMLAADLVYDVPGNGIDEIRRLLRTFDECGDVKERAARLAGIMRCIVGNPFRPVALDPSWRTETVVALATGIYDDRAFGRLPVLADALEDAGCVDAGVIAHCRYPGPHARGCWVVDLLLGKS